jgi:preprotein translocase subunit SecG
MSVLFTLLVILFLVVSVALVLIILVQRPQGGGLAQAFGGGGGGTDTAFGGRTGDALTYATVTAFGIYLVLAISLNILDLKMTKAAKEPAPAEADATQTAPATAPLTRALRAAAGRVLVPFAG